MCPSIPLPLTLLLSSPPSFPPFFLPLLFYNHKNSWIIFCIFNHFNSTDADVLPFFLLNPIYTPTPCLSWCPLLPPSLSGADAEKCKWWNIKLSFSPPVDTHIGALIHTYRDTLVCIYSICLMPPTPCSSAASVATLTGYRATTPRTAHTHTERRWQIICVQYVLSC